MSHCPSLRISSTTSERGAIAQQYRLQRSANFIGGNRSRVEERALILAQHSPAGSVEARLHILPLNFSSMRISSRGVRSRFMHDSEYETLVWRNTALGLDRMRVQRLSKANLTSPQRFATCA
jgi:hypothetical protein